MMDGAQGTNFIAEQLCRLIGGASVLPDADAEQLLGELAEAHGIDTRTIWWWQSVPNRRTTVYGSSIALWQGQLRRLLVESAPGKVFIAITDDDASPWPIVTVEDGASLIHALGELQFFEYFVFASDLSWIFFDTHDNAIIEVR